MEEQYDVTTEGPAQEQRQFGNYDLVRRIDMGGMGEVYLAHQRTAFHREVAVKIIRDDLAGDPLARARFFREAEVSSRLKHDHILPLFEFGEVDGRLFLVTPYISGGTLAQRLQAGALSLTEVHRLFTALVQAVAYVHRRGVIHRDLKPSNILLDDDESSEQVYVRLIDFGIATQQGAEATPPLTTAGNEVGTIAYMAPERLNGIAAPSNDIYSLGVILYQMLAGRLPNGAALASGTLPPPLEAVVLRCLAANPADRYTSAGEALHAFELACQELGVSATFATSGSLILPHSAALPPQPIYADPTVAVSASRQRLSKGHGRRPLFVIVPLLIIVVLFAMAGLVFFEFPLVASASINIGPQVHAIQQVYTVTAQPSQNGIDIAASTVPIYEKDDTLTGSLTGQTASLCEQLSFFRCRRVVTSEDVNILASQLEQSLVAQLSTQIDSQLQALHATAIGTKSFNDLTVSSDPEIGTPSSTVTVTLTEQGSIKYVSSGDVQQLARQLLSRQLGTGNILVNSTVQVSQPVVEALTDFGAVTMKVAATGVEEYRWSSTQLQGILSHITGMSRAHALAYLQRQPGVDASLVSISIHTIFGSGDTLPYSASQIKIIPINPTSLPATSLPALPTPTYSTD